MQELSLKITEKKGGRGIREIAREIGISPATLARVEAGKQPDLKTFRLICKWLEVDPNSILGLGAIPSANRTTSLPQAHFRAKRSINPETANHLAKLILAIQQSNEAS